MAFRFDSRRPIDQLVFRQSDTRNIPAFTAFGSFTIGNTYGKAFIPFIRYSLDGGQSWYENGQPVILSSTQINVAMNAEANDLLVTIYMQNNTNTARNILWEVYGVKHGL